MSTVDQLKNEFIEIVTTKNPDEKSNRNRAWKIIMETNGFSDEPMSRATIQTLIEVGIENREVEHNLLYRTTESIRAPLAAGGLLDKVQKDLHKNPQAMNFAEILFRDLLRSK